MRKILLILLVCFIANVDIIGQSLTASPSVIATSGNYVENGGLHATWTVGEVVIPTVSNGGIVATQGFNQPDKKNRIVECVVEVPSINILEDTATICSTGMATLSVDTDGEVLWSTGEMTASIVVSMSGSYSVTVTDTVGCSATSPLLNISGLSGDACFVCSESLDTLQLCRKGALYGMTDFPLDGDEVYNWYNESGRLVASFQGNPYYSPSSLGTYTLEVIDPDYPDCSQLLGPKTVTELNGCCELEDCEREVIGPVNDEE